MTDLLKTSLSRRAVLQTAAVGAVGINPALRAAVYAQGSDAPEKKEVKIGFIPLTDCASVVMASVLGIDKKYGVKIIPTKEASWAGVRDKLVNGELDFAHVLYGLVYGVHLGIGGPKKDMAVLMNAEQQRPGHHAVQEAGRQGRGGRRRPGQADGHREARIHLRPDLPHRHPRHVAVLLAGRQRHQPDARTPRSSPCRRRRWWPTCAWATWTASAWASPGTTAPSSTASASPPPPPRTSGRTTRKRCWAPPAEFVKKYPNTARAVTAAILEAGTLDRRQPGRTRTRWPRRSPTRATSTPAWTRSTSASWAATRTAWARPGTTPTT